MSDQQLTLEEEQEIRECVRVGAYGGKALRFIPTLLAEIDRLRGERQESAEQRALDNIHMLARRRIAARNRSTAADHNAFWAEIKAHMEAFDHILRICEEAGCRSQGVLRETAPDDTVPPIASVPWAEAKGGAATIVYETAPESCTPTKSAP
jgi:hypothetical protein